MSDELTLLKERADQLGIKYKDNIGIESLRNKVNAFLANDGSDEGEAPVKEKTLAQIAAEERHKQAKEQLELVRVRIACLNPAKAKLQGEIFTIGNKFVGTVRKFVAYGEATDNGYHVPKIIFDELKTRKFQQITTKKGPNGQLLPIVRMVSEFSIEVLEPLTREELERLAAAQAAAGGLD